MVINSTWGVESGKQLQHPPVSPLMTMAIGIHIVLIQMEDEWCTTSLGNPKFMDALKKTVSTPTISVRRFGLDPIAYQCDALVSRLLPHRMYFTTEPCTWFGFLCFLAASQTGDILG